MKNPNVFCGNGDSRLPRGELSKGWFYIKAQCGNTIPHAVYPFSMVSVGAYSGGYPSGYGINKLNCNGRPGKFTDCLKINGFTHFHHSGTGSVGKYYNYFKITPFYGENKDEFIKLSREEAEPGYYSAVIENGIKAELTAGIDISAHKYTFPNKGGRIAIDFSACGLLPLACQNQSEGITDINLSVSDNCVTGFIVSEGIKIYACMIIKNGTLKGSDEKTVRYNSDGKSEVYCGFSIYSDQSAKRKAEAAASEGFDRIFKNTSEKWEQLLSAIEICEEDTEKRKTFYSMLYHSFVKPGGLDGEYFDFATLWDQYKTGLPLVFSLFSEESTAIVKNIIKKAEKTGRLFNCYLMAEGNDNFDVQAEMLAQHALCDALNRGICEEDAEKLFDIMYKDLIKSANVPFLERGECQRNTHILDMADGCYYLSCLADKLGRAEAEMLRSLSENWRKAFDEKTGILHADREYYEGTAYNYSYRLMHCMDERIELSGGKEKFCDLLDKFFGFAQPTAIQQLDPADEETMKNGEALGRFEGYNNESDIETPYAYIYAGNHRRACEVIAEGRRLFSSDENGLPGNNDSGGLSSCYAFNALGIFPVCGADCMLIGTPMFKSVAMKLSSGKEFKIIANNLSDENIYVEKVIFNGNLLDNYRISTDAFMKGGILELYMTK